MADTIIVNIPIGVWTVIYQGSKALLLEPTKGVVFVALQETGVPDASFRGHALPSGPSTWEAHGAETFYAFSYTGGSVVLTELH